MGTRNTTRFTEIVQEAGLTPDKALIEISEKVVKEAIKVLIDGGYPPAAANILKVHFGFADAHPLTVKELIRKNASKAA